MRTYSTTVFCSSGGSLLKTDTDTVSCKSSSSGSRFVTSAALTLDCLRVSGGIVSGEPCAEEPGGSDACNSEVPEPWRCVGDECVSRLFT